MLPRWWEGDDVIVCVSGVHTKPNTKTQVDFFLFFTLGPGFKKSVFAGTKNARSVWTVGPNLQDFCIFKQKSFLCGQGLSLTKLGS